MSLSPPGTILSIGLDDFTRPDVIRALTGVDGLTETVLDTWNDGDLGERAIAEIDANNGGDVLFSLMDIAHPATDYDDVLGDPDDDDNDEDDTDADEEDEDDDEES